MKKTEMILRLQEHLKNVSKEEFESEINKIQTELGITACEMEDCPHCAYERQQEYEAELEQEAAIDFGDWLLGHDIVYIDNTSDGNIYDYNGLRLTMKELYSNYLKS